MLDAGALIALDRGDVRIGAMLARANEIHVPAGALAQAWRNPTRQVRLARAVQAEGVWVHPLDDHAARDAGRLCGLTGTADVIDASVVLLARQVGGVAVTSDPGDLRRLDAGIRLFAC